MGTTASKRIRHCRKQSFKTTVFKKRNGFKSQIRLARNGFVPRPPVKEDSLSITSFQGEEPYLAPPRNKKKDIIPDPKMFDAIDKHALQAPNSVRTSVKDLAVYLMKPATSDLEKLRAFYCWITNNIRYDVEGFFSGNHTPSDAASVLRYKIAVCQGYSELFYALCKIARIPCQIVSGFAKAFSYNPEIPYTSSSQTNHAWNIVVVNGEWRPVECTWGAGCLGDNNEFNWKFKEFYFLTDPEMFVHAHLPFMKRNEKASQAYQLLKPAVLLREYNRSVKPHYHSLEWGIEFLSHKEHVIQVSKELDIQLQGLRPLLENVTCHFVDRSTKQDYKRFTMILRMSDGVFNIHIRPQHPGKYDLTIFGKVDRDAKQYSPIVDYIIVCNVASPSKHRYPEHHAAWGMTKRVLEYGFTDDILSKATFYTGTGELEFLIGTTKYVPVTTDLVYAEEEIENLKDYVMCSYATNALKVCVKFPKPGFYAIKLFAKMSTDSKYELVGALLTESKTSPARCKPFPRYHTAWGALPKAVEYGFHPDIFSCSTFTSTDGELAFDLAIRKNIPVTCRLEYAGRDTDLKRYVTVLFSSNYLSVKARFNDVGFYAIKLYAKRQEGLSYDHVASFLVSNKSVNPNCAPFPHSFPKALECRCVVLEPSSGDLAINKKTLLRCIAPTMKRLMVADEIFSEKYGDIFEISMKPESQGDFNIFGSTEHSGSLDALFKFQVVPKIWKLKKT
ncbi:kyphoscoliosis peptidase-like [Gigantopelta aegis]|uniref:kyphoscoliosis peptidase-like n=1 Tax=Gigantopelta aegis TaxID=1735272 RepID=UPI001B88DE6E|nr:kyphoscoliosis peptidase-like [Gigantopelta aegis]